MRSRVGEATTRSTLGSCPRCSAHIRAEYLLIRYETNAGGYRQFAACPECGAVVHPD